LGVVANIDPRKEHSSSQRIKPTKNHFSITEIDNRLLEYCKCKTWRWTDGDNVNRNEYKELENWFH
jgi:hypothetical protein